MVLIDLMDGSIKFIASLRDFPAAILYQARATRQGSILAAAENMELDLFFSGIRWHCGKKMI